MSSDFFGFQIQKYREIFQCARIFVFRYYAKCANSSFIAKFHGFLKQLGRNWASEVFICLHKIARDRVQN